MALSEPVVISFSEPIDRQSFYRAFSISPDVAGGFSWSAADATCVFQPLENYNRRDEYTVTIGTDTADLAGNRLTEDLSFSFSAGPVPDLDVVTVNRISDGATLRDVVFLNNGPGTKFEKDESFQVTFNDSVPLGRRESSISLDPGVNLDLNWTSSDT